MGIRTKVLLAFLLCFGLVGWASLVLLERRMDAEFEILERADLVDSMGRVHKVLDASVASLHSQTRDWAEWTEMYDFIRAPSKHPAWARSNLAPQSLETADLSFVELLDTQGRVVWAVLPANAPPSLQIPAAVRTALARDALAAEGAGKCGLVPLGKHMALACAIRVVHSDLSGPPAGLVVMVRVLDERRVASLQEQTGFGLRLLATHDIPGEVQWWRGILSAHRLGTRDLALRMQPQVNVVYLPLADLARQPLAALEVRVPRELFVRTQSLQTRVVVQAIVSALCIALLLATAVHWLLIRKLRTFIQQLQSLAERAAWERRIVLPGQDELGMLASEVNLMLEMIEAQVKELTALSLTDALTGLANRRAFEMRLTLEFGRARRHGQPLSLLIIDVDFFKRFNDRYGHPAGDAALRTVAGILAAVCGRAVDLASRMGGEEFSLLLPATGMAGAVDMAQRIGQALEAADVAHADSSVASHLTASIGIASLHPSDESAHALVERADRALYAAKSGGRNRYHCDDPMALTG